MLLLFLVLVLGMCGSFGAKQCSHQSWKHHLNHMNVNQQHKKSELSTEVCDVNVANDIPDDVTYTICRCQTNNVVLSHWQVSLNAGVVCMFFFLSWGPNNCNCNN